MDYTKKTLGEFLSSPDETIRRNAVSILKQCQKLYGAITDPFVPKYCVACQTETQALRSDERCPHCFGNTLKEALT